MAPTRQLHFRLPGPPTPRALVVIFAVGWTVAAIAFWNVRELEAPPFAWIWPLLFTASAVSCWGFALWPASRGWLLASGGLSFVSVLSRSAGILQNLIAGTGPAGLDPAYAVIGLIIYPLFSIALLYVWDVGFGGLWRAHQVRGTSRRGGPGDDEPEHPRS